MRHKIYEATLHASLLSPSLLSLSLFPPPSGIINETQSYNEMRSSAGITNDVPLNRMGALSLSRGAGWGCGARFIRHRLIRGGS